MSLIDIPLRIPNAPVPNDVREFLSEAEKRVADFVAARNKPVRGFVPSCFEAVYFALQDISRRNLAPGSCFCEWGSGFGAAASLAAMLDFEAHGIEIDADLCEASRELANRFGLPVDFVQGSFIPMGAEKIVDRAYNQFDGELTLDIEPDDAYEQLERNIDDFDLIFAFPWPNDVKLTKSLFNRFAARGALLLLYGESNGTRLFRKKH